MFFLRPITSSVADQPVAMLALVNGSSNSFVICPPLVWPAQQPSLESWSAIYRLAYEQLMIAFGPSRFQRAIQPSLN
jgi:hypothetical protein